MHRILTTLILSLSLAAAHEHQHFVVANQAREAATEDGVVPALDTKGDVYKTEGPNDFEIYATTTGNKKLIMVYTHFRDLGAPKETTQEIEKKMYGDGRFLDIFHKQSHGKLSLSVTVLRTKTQL